MYWFFWQGAESAEGAGASWYAVRGSPEGRFFFGGFLVFSKHFYVFFRRKNLFNDFFDEKHCLVPNRLVAAIGLKKIK